MNIFPIEVYKVSRRASWFNKFYADNKAKLIKEHGSYYYSGNPEVDNKKQFSYYEALATFNSPTSVTVRFYSMEDPVYGGRGPLICKITGTVEVNDDIRGIIDNEMHTLSVREYERREEEHFAKL